MDQKIKSNENQNLLLQVGIMSRLHLCRLDV